MVWYCCYQVAGTDSTRGTDVARCSSGLDGKDLAVCMSSREVWLYKNGVTVYEMKCCV